MDSVRRRVDSGEPIQSVGQSRVTPNDQDGLMTCENTEILRDKESDGGKNTLGKSNLKSGYTAVESCSEQSVERERERENGVRLFLWWMWMHREAQYLGERSPLNPD